MNLNEREQLDLLVSRIADSEASDIDWKSFIAIAEREPSAWKQLAQAQRDQAALGLAVGMKLHAAERVDLPTADAARRYFQSGEVTRIPTWSRLASVTWAGWAMAAAVLLSWFAGGNFMRPASIIPETNSAGLLRVNTPEDAVQAYLDVGKKQNTVIGEVPQRIYVQSRPTADGKMEVIFVRQFIERAEVKDLLKFAQTENGGPVPVRVSVPSMPGRAD